MISDEYDYLLERRLNGNDPSLEFRKLPDSEEIDEWLLAMGKAVGHMPAIKVFQWKVSEYSSNGIEVKFLAGNKKWLVVFGSDARWEVSQKIRRMLGLGLGLRLRSGNPFFIL